MMILVDSEAKNLIGVEYAVMWNSMSEMLADMRKPAPVGNWSGIRPSTLSWLEGSLRDVAKGDRCRMLAQRLTSRIPSFLKEERKLRRTWADDAGELSIDRYLDDNENCWRRIQRPRKQSKTIRLMAEISSTGCSSDEELITRCGTIVALAQWLEDHRYDIEILASDFSCGFLDGTQHYGSYYDFEGGANPQGTELGTVRVKTVDEPLDVDKLAAILGSQQFGYDALLRAVVHACPKRVVGSWGKVIPVPQRVLDNLQVDVSVPRFVMHEEHAVNWLTSVAQKLAD